MIFFSSAEKYLKISNIKSKGNTKSHSWIEINDTKTFLVEKFSSTVFPTADCFHECHCYHKKIDTEFHQKTLTYVPHSLPLHVITN